MTRAIAFFCLAILGLDIVASIAVLPIDYLPVLGLGVIVASLLLVLMIRPAPGPDFDTVEAMAEFDEDHIVRVIDRYKPQ